MFFPGAAVYMEKIAVGPEGAGAIDLKRTPTENVQAVAAAKGMRVTTSPSSCSSATATTR